MNIGAKLGAHGLIQLGAAMALWAIVQPPGDTLLIAWLVFTGAALVADW